MGCCCSHPLATAAGKHIDYDWNPKHFAATPEDTERVERELKELLASPDHEWVTGSLAKAKLQYRPIKDVRPGTVSRCVIDYDCGGAAELFAYLMTPEGFYLLDPSTSSASENASAREYAFARFQHKGYEGFAEAPILKLPFGSRRVCPNVIWYDTKQCLLVTYALPEKTRHWWPAQAQGIKKTFNIVYGLRILSLGEGRIRMEQVMWFDLTPMQSMIEAMHKGYYKALDKRLRAHLAKTTYGSSQSCRDKSSDSLYHEGSTQAVFN